MGKPDFCIIGPGRVGTALAVLLHDAGWNFLGAIGRRIESAERACEAAGCGHASCDPSTLTAKSGLVLITTPDDAIGEVCDNVARNGGFSPGTVVAHCSGRLASGALKPARKLGAHTGSIHPLQSFASCREAARVLPGSYCSIEGDTTALKTLNMIAGDLELHTVQLLADKKPLYHAGAVMASNFLVALQDIAQELERKAGLSPEESRAALSQLVKGTVDNIESLGTVDALTGPFARGDIDTIKKHMESLRRHCPAALPAYKALGQRALELGEKQGDICCKDAGSIRNLLTEVSD